MEWVTHKISVTAQRPIPLSYFFIWPGLRLGLGLDIGLVNKMLKKYKRCDTVMSETSKTFYFKP